MNLTIDAGNTRLKYAFFDRNQLIETRYQEFQLFEDIERWKKAGIPIDIFLSGSGWLKEDLRLSLQKVADLYIEASPLMNLPLHIGYDTPDTLGFDRIASCTGAMKLFPGCPLLVIDSGTCITFNYIDAQGVFLGGNISPGLEMRFKGLHHFTARLPLLEPGESYGGIGRTTEQAIRNGVMDGMLFEVEHYMKRFVLENTDGKVVITGGNSHFLERHLAMEAEFCKDLGFIGLNEIFQYTKKLNKLLK